MREIRPITENEAEPFLQLLCDVFDLNFNRAYDLFFQEPLFDLNRKWALFEGQEMISILTTTPLKFGWGDAFGVAGVATRENRRGEGYAGKLIERVIKESRAHGEEASLVFAANTALYERCGFEPLDRVIRGPVKRTGEVQPVDGLPIPEIRELYDRWSYGHSDRLRRDEKRWQYFEWHYRVNVPFQSGYLSIESTGIRESLFFQPAESLPVLPGTEWYGLTNMADQFEIPLENFRVEMYLLGYNVPGVPQMFMSDQF